MPSIGLTLTVVRVLAVALLVSVSAMHFRNQCPVLTCETYVMGWDVGALVEDTDKLKNFVEDDFDFFEYEHGRSSCFI